MRRLVPLAFAFVVFVRLASAASIPFPQESSDLAMDPAALHGTLPNGLRYVVRANKEPRDRVSLRLLVEAGAVHEQEDQQGLAHFLEHMAFNGSTHYPPDTLIKFFQRMGMNFGGDTNASTWYTRTLYLLELPDTKGATVTEGLKVFRDYADGLLLQAGEIDKERGIILSEKRTRDSVDERTRLATDQFLLRGTMFAKRDVIGTDDVLKQAGRERFADFYDTWYRPELMSLVIVGDIDPPAIVRELTEAFTSVRARAPARPQPDLGRIHAFSGTQAFYHYEAEAPDTGVTIATLVPYTKEPDTGANRVKQLPRMIAHAILNRRLSILAKKEGAPFKGGRTGAYEAYGFYRQSVISLRCKAGQWTDALGVADQELRRALEHGFQKPELQEVVANVRNSLEQAVKTASTRRSDGIADEIAESLLERDVWTTPEADLALYAPALAKITVEDCVAALRDTWSPAHRLVMITGNAKVADGDQALAAITTAFEKSRALAVKAPEAVKEATWAYTSFGAPGKIAKTDTVADLGITLLQFENGVRLNLKKTDFEANSIGINVRLGHGQLGEPRGLPGLSSYANQTLSAGGLGRHSADDLRQILAGRTVGTNIGVGSDAFVLNGGTNREDLLLTLQLLTARITDPGYRPEAARQAKKAIEDRYLSYAHTTSGPFTLEVARLLANGDARFGLPAKEEMLKRNLDEVKAWLAPELAAGPIEVAIVGDIDVDATIAAVARTLGALPARKERTLTPDSRPVSFPAEPFTRSYEVDTEIPKGVIAVYWPTTDGRDVRRARRLNLLGEVFNDRLRQKVREELGDAYNPWVGSTASDLFAGYGYLQSNVTIDPPRARQVADIIVQIAADLAAKGVTDEELERAKKPVLTSLRESSRTNSYWLGSVLARAQTRPEVLEWCRTRYADNESITATELSELASRYLGGARASRATAIPVGKRTPGTASAPAETAPRK